MNDEKQLHRGLRFCTIDGALSTVWASFCGGIFLTGYALKVLNASAGQIGLLAALPTIANVTQLLGSYLIEKTGEIKKIWFLFIIAHRGIWIFIILLPLAIFAPLADWRVWVLVVVIGVSSVFSSLSGLAWMSWMSHLVPEKMRGSYFGKRNMISSACGMAALLLGGKFLSIWGTRFSGNNPYGFVILFTLGLAAGLVAIWYGLQVPHPHGREQAEGQEFDPSIFIQPFRDKNYLALMLFVSGLTFALQLAAPFYGVYMIENLKADFSTITFFMTIATLATLVMMKFWGPISDLLGNKPIIIVSGWVLIGVPLVWIFALPGQFYWPVLTAHILTGAFTAGVTLSQFNIQIKLAPQRGRSVYLAVFAATTGVVSGLAPILGGMLSEAMKGISLKVLAFELTNLHVIFLLSSLLMALVIFFILRVREMGAATPYAVVMQLKNDLDPLTGIASVMDFAMIELERTEGVLTRFDRVTDELADRSEKRIETVLGRLIRAIEKPWKKFKDFLHSED